MRNLLIGVIFGFIVTGNLQSQIGNPGIDEVFRPGELGRIDITLSDSDKKLLVEGDQNSDFYYSVSLRFRNTVLDTTVVNVGIRIRGRSSRWHPKRSYKIDFKEFGGEKFFNYKKFDLEPNINDPSLAREPLSCYLYKEVGVPAMRYHFHTLFMNDEYMGVYLNIEHIDDEFVDRRFGSESGNLYKSSYSVGLTPETDVYNDEILELKTNEDINDRSGVERLIHILATVHGNAFADSIEAVFNVDNYLRQLAVETLIGHWDGYSYMGSNYYLYENPKTRKIEYIPYDLDNTWGIDWIGRDWESRDLFNWAHENGGRPLTQRILEVNEYKHRYTEYLKELLDKHFTEPDIQSQFDQISSLIYEPLGDDVYYSHEDGYGFTTGDFTRSISESGPAWQVKFGILEYLGIRRSTALDQLDLILGSESNVSKDQNIRLFPNPVQNILNIEVLDAETFRVQVISSDGRILFVREGMDSSHLDMSACPQGMYVIKISTTKGMIVRKVYKE
jgi:spore coat protein CotH